MTQSHSGDVTSSTAPTPLYAFFLRAMSTAARPSNPTKNTTPKARKEGTYGVENEESHESTSQSGKSFL